MIKVHQCVIDDAKQAMILAQNKELAESLRQAACCLRPPDASIGFQEHEWFCTMFAADQVDHEAGWALNQGPTVAFLRNFFPGNDHDLWIRHNTRIDEDRQSIRFLLLNLLADMAESCETEL